MEKEKNILDDDRLMELTGQGNQSAFRILYSRWSRRVMAYAYRVLRDRSEAEDIVQETFTSLYKTSSRYLPQGKFQSFLFRIAGNQVRTRLRDRVPLPVEDIEELHESSGYELSRDEKIDLEEALSRISPEQKEDLLLAVMGGLTYKEIASMKGTTESAVAQRICRGRLRLRQLLQVEKGDGSHEGTL